MEKKSNFVQVPLWLLSELSGKEIKLFCRMYNGWCLMKDADGWYYRSISKLKEDADIKSKCNNEVINAILHFEELGIVIVDRNGKKTNKFKFDEHLMFNHEEYDTNDSEEGCMQNTYKGCMQNTYKQVEGDVCKMHTIYNTKENIKENISSNNITCTGTEDNRTVPPDINGIQFWDNPLIYVMDLVSFPYDNYWCPLKDFIKQGYFKEVREAISQIEDKALREYLNEDIDNCIQRLKSA